MYKEVIYLVSTTSGDSKDEYGDILPSQNYTELPAKQKSIGIKEFYQAQTQGKRPECKFIIADYLDYNGQEELIHDDTRYKVLRTYRTDGSNELEITCYGGVRNGNTTISN